MKIHLYNFLCYEDKSFDFGNNGLVLVSGPSGAGKTTILKAIFFAFFGEGNKVQMYGKTNCKVELEFEDMKIIRTKKPNRLILNDTYEDNIAQEIINNKLGNTFKTSGYIPQNNINTFIMMSPTDKLLFLEQFAFKDINLTEIKNKCKIQINKTSDDLTAATSKLELAKTFLLELPTPETIDFPIKCKPNNRDVVIKNENTRLKKVKLEIKKCNDNIKLYTEIINKENIYIAQKTEKIEQVKILENKAHDLYLKILDTKEKLILDTDNLLEKEKKLEYIINNRKLQELNNQYNQNIKELKKMANEEEINIKEQIKIIEENLWLEYSKEELELTLKDLKITEKDAQRIESLKNDLKKYNLKLELEINLDTQLELELEKKLDLELNLKLLYKQEEELKINLENKINLLQNYKLKQETYQCPSCNIYLHFNGKILEQIDNNILDNFNKSIENTKNIENINTQIIELKQQLKHICNEIQDKVNIKKNIIKILTEIKEINIKYEETLELNNISLDINYLINYRQIEQQKEIKLKKLKEKLITKDYSPAYKNFKLSIENLKQNILNIQQDNNKQEIKEEELRKLIICQKQLLKDINSYENQLKQIEKEIEIIFNSIILISNNMSEYYSKTNIDKNKIREELNKMNEILVELYTQEKNHIKNLNNIEVWLKNEEIKDKYKEWEHKIKILIKEEEISRNKYTASMILKNKILEAESIAMKNIIDSINIHAREYLDSFFPEYPILVELQTFKETKKSTSGSLVKPCINVMIEYKSMECDLQMLSGGELSRIVLAYTLALSEMFNTPLLLLDECTASLDQELTSVVFEGIKDNFKGKLVLIIAHQVVSGTFDTIIKL